MQNNFFKFSTFSEFLKASKHIDGKFATVLIGALSSGSNLFIYCYCGQSAHECYFDLQKCFYEADWLKLPNDLQKYLIVMIENAQRPLFYNGFGLAYLNLNTFVQMIKTALSYYMIFKRLNSH